MNWLDWIAMDPGHGVVWWQIDADGFLAARHRLERLERGATLVLRITQRTSSGPRTTELALDGWSGERVIALGEPGAEHHAAIGLKAGDFYTSIARAPRLISPPLRENRS